MREVSLGLAIIPTLVVLGYMAVLLWMNRRSYGVQEFNEFATANRAFGVWAITFSMMATWYVGASYTAWMGMAVNFGFVYTYTPVYGAFCLILLYLILDKMWIWGATHQLNTQGALWGLRYNSNKIKALAGVVGVIASFPWLIMEFWTIGYLLSHGTYGYLPFLWAMLIGAAIIAVYVALGGMRAVITAHFVQGLLFALGATVFTYILIYMNTGGFAPTIRNAVANFPEILTYPGPGWNPPPQWWASIIITSSVGGFLWPWAMNRVFASDSVRTAKRATWQAITIGTLICVFFLFFGLSAHSLGYARENPQMVWLWLSDNLGGPVFLTLALLVAMSAVLSTTASLIHFFGASIAEDVLKPLNSKLDSRQATRLAQYVVFGVSVLAFFIANMELPMLIFVALLTYQFIIQLGPGQLLGMYWKRGNAVGAVAGMIAGLAVAFYLTYLHPEGISFGGWTPGVWGLVVNTIIYIGCGYALPVDKRTEELFQEVENYHRQHKLAAAGR